MRHEEADAVHQGIEAHLPLPLRHSDVAVAVDEVVA